VALTVGSFTTGWTTPPASIFSARRPATGSKNSRVTEPGSGASASMTGGGSVSAERREMSAMWRSWTITEELGTWRRAACDYGLQVAEMSQQKLIASTVRPRAA
jgi:hypothetical protein